MDLIVRIFEIIGTIAFAVSGATLAIKKELDIFGVIVIGVITAVGGGATRDIILGYLPPALFRDPIFVIIATVTCVIVFALFSLLKTRFAVFFEKLTSIINICDAVGLGIFVAIGMSAAIKAGYGENGFLLVFVGTITGVGGGLLRDVIVGVVPYVLKKHVYAVAAIGGAILYLITYNLNFNSIISYMICAVFIVTIRLLATKFEWNLPKVKL